jgi:hypothetical protein
MKMPESVIVGYDPQRRPIFAEVLSAEEIGDKMLESSEWKRFSERFDMSDAGNVTLLNGVFADKLGPDADLSDYTQLLNRIIAAGGVVVVDGTSYEFVLNTPEEVVEEPEVPVDINGRPLSESQIRWSEYRQYAESHSMKEVRERARVDAGFSSFVQKNYQRETGTVGDAVENLNARNERANQISEELKAWADEYRRMPNAKVQQLRLPSFNPNGYQEFIRNFDAACAAGLI